MSVSTPPGGADTPPNDEAVATPDELATASAPEEAAAPKSTTAPKSTAPKSAAKANLSASSPDTPRAPYRNPNLEETTVLTPVSHGTSAIDRMPLSHRRRWIVVTAILTLLLLSVVAFAGYLWDVTRKWEAQAAQAQAISADLGERLATEQSEVVRLQQELDITNEQLSTAQQRITELADLAAQTGDDVQYYVQEINAQRELAQTGSAVATALNRCIEGQRQLAVYLRDADNYDPQELADYETSLKTLCDNAISANSTFQQAFAQ